MKLPNFKWVHSFLEQVTLTTTNRNIVDLSFKNEELK